MCPSKNKAQEYCKRASDIPEQFNQVRKGFMPDSEQRLVAPTRFSSKPQPPNTFVNYQPNPTTPGFISEQQRFGGT